MGRWGRFNPTIEELTTLRISKLKEFGYLDFNSPQNGVLTWSNRSGVVAEVGIRSIRLSNDYILLDYRYNGIDRDVRIKIEYVPSNLCEGEVMYFVCPITGKRARNLYLSGGWFGHRTAFNYLYESQAQGKKMRQIERSYGFYFDSEKICKRYYQKHRKKQYNGIPTKEETKLKKLLERLDKIEPWEIERLYLL